MKDETFLDLRARLAEARGRLLLAMSRPQHRQLDVVEHLAQIVGHLGRTLQRVHLQVYRRPVGD